MNKEQFQGQWKQIKGKVKEKWGKLTEDDLTQINGKRDQLVGKLQQRYGIAKERAEEELKNWEKTFSSFSQSSFERHDEEQEEPITHKKPRNY